MKKPRFPALLLPLLVVLAAIAWYGLLFRVDNCYTAALDGGYGRALWPGGDAGPAFLVDGWEYYPGQLLEPADFAAGTLPARYTFPGQLPNFSRDLGSAYGTATYRLTLENTGQPQTLVFYLPELLSAGRVYIDGVPVGEQGSTEPYVPCIRDGLYTFTLTDSAEIIVQCANYTHYYSGMYYPPAVGTAQDIARMLGIRLAVYGLLCFSALTLALVFLVQWAPAREARTRWMGLLCLGYALRVCCPLLRAMGLPSGRLLYALEDGSGNLVLLCAVLLVGSLSGAGKQWFHRAVAVPAAAALCLCTVVFPIGILPYTPDFINLYGLLLFAWKLVLALYLLVLAIHTGRVCAPLRGYLVAATTFFGVSLAVSVLSANRLEPICGAWAEEYGGFALVVGFAAMLVRQNLDIARENARLTLHLQEEVDRKTHSMEQLLQERRELLARVLHDLKNPLAALCSYAELVRYGGVELDAETEQYLDALSSRAGAVRDRLHHLQDFSRAERGLTDAKPLCLNAFLDAFYAANRPDIELSGVTFRLQLPDEPLWVRGCEERLRIALENLCYNALSFTPCDGMITLELAQQGEEAVLSVTDTGCGIAPEDLPHVFDRGFTRRPDDSGEGLGLFLVRAIALEHGGRAEVKARPGAGSTFLLYLPTVPPPGA